MPETKIQTFQNHARLDPLFHFFVMPVGFGTVIYAIYALTQRQTGENVAFLIFSLALLVAFFKIRAYSVKVQDRVIRLEERLRLLTLLHEPLRSRIPELTEGQLVALRFASDAEVAILVEKVLANPLTSKEIKSQIVDWRPDYFRV
jgi:hypothetical protein